MKKVCVVLADGFEEIEAVTVIDVLRRAGVEVTALSLSGEFATGNHGISLRADASLEAVGEREWDAVILPGGMPGAATLRDDPAVQSLLRRQAASGRTLAAICAAPIALGRAGALQGRAATCYPGFDAQLTGATLSDAPVVIDGAVITSRGPGTAMEFSLSLTERLVGPDAAATLRRKMLVG